jgi:hypothetical protein
MVIYMYIYIYMYLLGGVIVGLEGFFFNIFILELISARAFKFACAYCSH